VEKCTIELKNQLQSKVLNIIGDAWSLRIFLVLSERESRFCEMERDMEGINPTTLTAKLKKLQDAKYIVRQAVPKNRQAVCYSLTAKGKEIIPIILEIKKFIEKNHSR